MRASTALAWAYLLILPAALRATWKSAVAHGGDASWSRSSSGGFFPGLERPQKHLSYLKMERFERGALRDAYLKGDAAAKAWFRNENSATFEKE